MNDPLIELQNKHSIAMGALANLETMFQGLKDTPDSATLGNMRTIINAYENTTKKALLEIILLP